MEKSVLLKFLRKVDDDFVPTLSQKTDLDEFCTKIMSKAMLFVSYAKDGNINGLVVMYANDFEHHYSYVSLVAVDLSFRKQGIADSLMRKAISYVKNLEKTKSTVLEFIRIMLLHCICMKNLALWYKVS